MIQFVDLKAQYHSIKREIDDAISRVLESGRFVLGEEVAAYETEFADYCGTEYGIGLNSGTSALHLALLAAGIRPGDEVITTPFTFVATVAAIYYSGARPVFVDIDPGTLSIDPDQIESAITPYTRAIMPVHLHGQLADMGAILDIAQRHDLLVIEDAAQAHGAVFDGWRAGSMGALGCFSFYPAKNLGAYGEAGMVVTDNPDYADRIRMLRDWGQAEKHQHELPGYNNRMDALQGAVLRVKLRYLDDWNTARRERAALYDELLARAGIGLPPVVPGLEHIYHVYAIRTPERDALQAALGAQGIPTGIHYPLPVHQMDAYADLGFRAGQFPHAEQAAAEVLSLPMYPELPLDHVEQVADAILAFFGA
ncbi:MAG: DegT/DnrJ/EryC1/StrS family aminotransferase [Chloroflexi bacterium]|nr:DegT/DnrJ/EryC1/StrS family aminotransferase [Chloroflexota bacterium]